MPRTHIATVYSTSRRNVAKLYRDGSGDYRVKFIFAGAWVEILDAFTGTSAEAFEVAEESLAIQDDQDSRCARSEEMGLAFIGHVRGLQVGRPAGGLGAQQ